MNILSSVKTLWLCIIAVVFVACIEDGVSTDPSDQPEFSVDTLRLGTVFTLDATPTRAFRVYNRHDKGISLSSVKMRDGDMERIFRLNVDGISGRDFSNIDIRANDSIYVFVEATFPENGNNLPDTINASLDFTVNGRVSTVIVNAVARDVVRMHAEVVDHDITLSAGRPYQIFDSLVVGRNAVLTIEPGVELCFHDGARFDVHGSVVSKGDVDRPVYIGGDRRGSVVGKIDYEIMSRQWPGIRFFGTSEGNYMSHTVISNTEYGVRVDSSYCGIDSNALTLINCRLRNSGDHVLEAYCASVKAVGCEFAEAAGGVLRFIGGRQILNHCTIANYYLFSPISGPLIEMNPNNRGGISARIANSIIYGVGVSVSPLDLSGRDIIIDHTLIKETGVDDENFRNILWGVDPMYRTVREEYYFDYRLLPESPAIKAGSSESVLDEGLRDFYGHMRLDAQGDIPDLGAYVFEK